MKGAALVIGSGVSGMRATAELAAQGFKVFLLEEKPTLGGATARLDKMYPTNECATCTLIPKMLDLTSNAQSVQIISFADLKEVTESGGVFKVRIVKKPRYVDPMKCNACSACLAVCPVGGVPSEFDLGRGSTKAIGFWSPFPPRKALINPDACTYIRNGRCGEGAEPLCAKACEPGAVAFSQKPAEVVIEVGAIVLASGADEERGKTLARFGQGRMPNVLTALEFERLLSGLGPTTGVVKRDDGVAPKRVAWIVCGDFGQQPSRPSPVAFMSAVSEALGTLERDAKAEVSVISAGIQSDGKGCASFREEARKRGVRLVTGSSVEVRAGQAGNALVSYVEPSGAKGEIEAQMLVLSPPLAPAAGLAELAGKLGIQLGRDGFVAAPPDGHPLRTTREGAFVCGTVLGPKGIQECVIQACGAAACVAGRLAEARGTEVAPAPKQNLLPVKPEEQPRIAVVICRCGNNIAGALDVQDLADYVATLPRVAKVEITPFGCDGVKVKELLATGQYNRMVVGACSPRTHEPLFQIYTEGGGISRYLMEIVNLRNHCTWVHAQDKEGLARKAKALMRAGVARAALQEPLSPLRIPVTQSCLVVGGTLAGLACAAKLGEMGYQTHLVISEERAGAGLTGAAGKLAAASVKAIEQSGKVRVCPRAKVGRIRGYVGNYEVELRAADGPQSVKVGAVVVATREKMGAAAEEGDYEAGLYLTRDSDGFFVGALGNLNPLDFNTDGVFMCGSARAEETADASLASGLGAASRAAGIISRDSMAKSPVTSCVVDRNCDGCAFCIEPCPAHAITLIEYMREGQTKKTVQVNEALCKGCGSCMATCPKAGIYVHHFRPDQLKAMVDAVLETA
jgi:heterodisulfide reductase subunit A